MNRKLFFAVLFPVAGWLRRLCGPPATGGRLYLHLQRQRILEDWALSQRRHTLFSPPRIRWQFLRECPSILGRKVKRWRNGIFGYAWREGYAAAYIPSGPI